MLKPSPTYTIHFTNALRLCLLAIASLQLFAACSTTSNLPDDEQLYAGIKEVYYLSDKYATTPTTIASKRMMDAAGVKYTQLKPSMDSITLDFIPEENK